MVWIAVQDDEPFCKMFKLKINYSKNFSLWSCLSCHQ